MTHATVANRPSVQSILGGDPANELHYVTKRRTTAAAGALCGYSARFTLPGMAGVAGDARTVCATCAVLYNALPA